MGGGDLEDECLVGQRRGLLLVVEGIKPQLERWQDVERQVRLHAATPQVASRRQTSAQSRHAGQF